MKANIKITIERILAYLRQTLTNRERHDLEREVMRDPFDEEAFEGLSQLSADEAEADLHKLKQQLAQRTQKKRTLLLHPATRIAATILLVVGLLVIIQVIVRDDPQDRLISDKMDEPTTGETVSESHDLVQEHEEDKAPEELPEPVDDTGEDEGEQRMDEKPVVAELKKAKRERTTTKSSDKSISRADDKSSVPETTFNAPLEMADEAEVQQAVETLRASEKGLHLQAEKVFTQIQDHTVRGTVMTADGDPLPGVSIHEKGTTNGTVSDLTGAFELELQDTSNILAFSFVGYATEEMVLSDIADEPIVMDEDMMALEEVVVVGYGSHKKGDLTGAVSTVEADGTSRDKRGPYNGPMPPSGTRKQFKEDVQHAIRDKQPEGWENIDKLVIRFMVYADGRLGEFDFQEDIDEPLKDEIVKIIRSQGRWKPATQGSSTLKTKVRIRLKME